MKAFLILGLLISLSCSLEDAPSQNPVIGVFTQTYTSQSSYIAASYVKFLEMAGAQVVPIFSFSETSEVLSLLKKINGVLFPGGGMQFNMNNQWTKNADAILKYAIAENDKGNQFPIFGTCLGMQLLSYLTSNHNNSILSRVHEDEAIIHPISILDDGYLFNTLTTTQRQKITKGTGLFYFNHNYAVTLDTYNSNIALKNFWNLIATATTNVNQKFVAVLQGKKYPFYAVQFHPEKNPFEWRVHADRSYTSVQVVHMVANKFVDVARKSVNRFNSVDQLSKIAIYNYKTSVPSSSSSFSQVYVFTETPRIKYLRSK